MYRFKSGKVKGKTMEQAMLRYAPRLYWIVSRIKEEVEERQNIQPLLRHFDRLRHRLRIAPVFVKCYRDGCKQQPKWMTLALDWGEKYLRPDARFWCDKHGPHRDPDEEDESQKVHIHFDALRHREYCDRRSQKAIDLAVLVGLGIEKKPTRITEAFAMRFFANLR